MFKNIASLVREKRAEKKLSQKELANYLRWGSPQLVSNIERALCSVPARRINQFAIILETDPATIREAMVKDYASSLERF